MKSHSSSLPFRVVPILLWLLSTIAHGQSWPTESQPPTPTGTDQVTLSLEGGNVQVVPQDASNRNSAYPGSGDAGSGDAGSNDDGSRKATAESAYPQSAFGQIQYSTPPMASASPVPPSVPENGLPPSSYSADAANAAKPAVARPGVTAVPCLSGACGQPGYGGVASVYGETAREMNSWVQAPGRVTEPQPNDFFFRWDRLYTSIDAAASGRIARPTAGSVVNNAVPVTSVVGMGGDLFNERPDFGDRIEFGFHDRGDIQSPGWMMSILFMNQTKNFQLSGGVINLADPLGTLLGFSDADLDGFADDQDGDLVFGADGRDTDGDGIPDVPAPQDDDDLLSMLPVYSNITGRNRINMDGFELMRFRSMGDPTAGLYWMHGVRYFNVDERYTISATGSFIDFSADTSVENFILGPQIGVGYGHSWGPVRFDGVFRFMAGVNSQRGKQTSSTTGFGGAALNAPLNAIPAASSSTILEDTQFSPLLEWRAELSHYVTPHLAFRVGYTGWFVGGITRASGMNYSLPDFVLDLGASDTVVANSLTLGMEFSF